jgi:chemotaxis protein CheD
MANVIIGIAEMAVSDHADDVLVTYSLGSCLGVAIYDPVLKVGGMIHCMLPLSKVDPDKAAERPAMFVDTGLPRLLTDLFQRGMQRSRAVIKVAGAANVLDHQDLFKIGERNYTVLRKILWKNSMLIAGEDVGGHVSRTVRLEIATGRFVVRSGGKEVEL